MTPLEALLAEQRDLTAVERFAEAHEARPLERWSELIPISAPRAGQQYAFEVDLDACTGCKACVTGCHTMNGLDDGEVWRTVGLLVGGSSASPFLQTVTTSCHHCLEPACMHGCPAAAYEKDPVTGIVKHLDDACIGCQYCTFTCPYDAPKYNRARGIVRKCDLCSDRLAAREAPACAQACPNQAIRITVVDEAQAVAAAEANAFLPSAPGPSTTLPTTRYETARALPRNLLPADHHSLRREAAHLPLVVMLVLTQLSVGTFALRALGGGFAVDLALGARGAWLAVVLGLAALGASVLHLGRPLRAWRALFGLRRSWLSREILAFSVYALLAFGSVIGRGVALGGAAAIAGLLGVFSSVMVYAVTERALWRGGATTVRFFGSSALLGAATLLMVAPSLPLCRVVVALAALKLLWEASLFRHLRARTQTPMKRSAVLMSRELAALTGWRFVLGAIGGLVLPGGALLVGAAPPLPLAIAVAIALLAGELAERYLFFAASVAPRMPGGVA